MTLTTKERKALEAAEYPGGVDRGELSLVYVGAKTIAGLLERGLLERLAHPVAKARFLFKTTDAGKAALAALKVGTMRPARPKLTMLKPRIATLDTRIVRPLKPKR
jgi:hypothetical protein